MKKNYFVAITLFVFAILFNGTLFAQGATCEDADPFCAGGTQFVFPNTTGVPSFGDIACLASTPNPAWFYLQVAETGLLQFEILQNSSFDANGNPNGTPIDVDFAVWGPFSTAAGNCSDLEEECNDPNFEGSINGCPNNTATAPGPNYPYGNIVDCSYDSQSIETMTIPNAQAGEYYLVLITNFTFTLPGTAGFIRLTQTNLGDPGSGSTDCSIVLNDYICEGGFLNIEATDLDGSDYQWSVFNEVTEVFDLLPGETNPTLDVTESGLYLVEYLDSLGDPIEEEIQVNITELPLPELAFADPLEFCEDEAIVIDGTPSNIDDLEGVTYVWYYEGDEIPGETSAVLNAAPNNYGTYTVEIGQIVDDCGLTVDIQVTGCVIDPVCNTVAFLEDFGTGVGRFETPFTEYDFVEFGEINGGDYAVSNTTAGMNGGWFTDMSDHTGDPDGRMFVVNPLDPPGVEDDELYRRTIDVSPNTDYTFSYFMTTVYDINSAICIGTGDPSNILLRIEDIDGNTIVESETGEIPNGSDPNWLEFTTSFNSLDETEVQFVFINLGLNDCGNDLAIDDITLTVSTDVPVLVTPEDMIQCDISGTTSTFDLTTQIPVILDGQDPAEFNVSFHLFEAEASTNSNPIATPEAYENIDNPQTIYIRVENVNQPTCFSIVQFDLIVEDGIDLETDLPDTLAFCDNETFPVLDATPTNAGIDLSLVTYEWYLDGDLISQDATITPTESGVYTVIIEHDECSQLTVDIDVNIQEAPLLDLGVDETFCEGDSFEIIPLITGNSANTTYLWSTGETTPTITVNTSGTYSLEITDESCLVTDEITVSFNALPNVDLGETVFSCPGEVQLITAVTDATDATFTWFEDGVEIAGETSNTLSITTPTSIAMTSVFYSVEVNAGECVSTDEVEVRSYPDNPKCVISQGISPGGSIGQNDNLDLTFLAARTGIENVQIFNRYGALVYEKNNYVNEWVGQSKNGDELPTGTYFYTINFTGEDVVYGNQKTGWIYINRDSN